MPMTLTCYRIATALFPCAQMCPSFVDAFQFEVFGRTWRAFLEILCATLKSFTYMRRQFLRFRQTNALLFYP